MGEGIWGNGMGSLGIVEWSGIVEEIEGVDGEKKRKEMTIGCSYLCNRTRGSVVNF